MRRSGSPKIIVRLVAAVLVTLLLSASPASAAVGKKDRCKKNCEPAAAVRAETGTRPITDTKARGRKAREAPPATDEAPAPTPASYRSGTSDAADQLGSLYNVVDQIGARSLWEQGITGEGVDVAVIDTGVAPVPALTGSDKVGAMVDLSFEAEVPEAVYLDTHGHGTHMAGIIAGSDPGGDPATAAQRPDEFQGVAPGSRLVSVKVGDNTGAVDVSQVIAAIDWVVEHRNEGDLNIRVINLSYGTDGDQDYRVDPLAYAVERAWDAGIVVVAAAGNDGWMHPGLANPAADPFILSVGAAQALDGGYFWIPEWASGGELFTEADDGDDDGWDGFWEDDYSGRYPDLVAPGASIESLRVPGSRVATEHSEGFVNDTILRGSGTSQSAAVVSGAVALLLQERPGLSPDQVKALLMDSASELPFVLRTMQGAGLVDVAAAADASTPETTQDWDRSTGTGSLEASRGSVHVSVNGEDVVGEVTVWGDEWDADAWVDATALGSSWTGGEWTGSSWTGSSWTGSSWTGSSWTGSSWTGSSWTGSSWTGSSWTGSSWTGSSWTGSSWTGSSWTGSSWTGSSWTGSSWTGSSWTGSSWTGDGWQGVTW